MKKILTTAIVITLAAHLWAQGSRIDKQLTIYNQVLRELDVNFVDTLDYDMLTNVSINAMLSRTDPYTVYYPAEKTQTLTQMTTGKYAGVGATISAIGDTVYISHPYAGKPAYKAGLRAGDAILAIDGEKMVGKATSDVSQKLRGKIGSTLKVKVKRYGVAKPLTFTFEREQIQLDAVTYAGVLDGNMGYVAFSEFTENSSFEFRHAVERLVSEHGIDGLVIDLRGNGGGLISEAARILSYFIPEGTAVVVTKSHNEPLRTYKTQQPPLWGDMPLVVLVDEDTASAAEIVAGTLQDLDRAVILGQRTFGKGLVQTIHDIYGGGHLKVTVARYYIPSGRCIQAVDYRHSTDDGKPYHTPDSLCAEYHTRAGRIVRDGGGIQPDIVIDDKQNGGSLSYMLMQDQQFMLFVNRFVANNSSIDEPEKFQVTDDILEQMRQYLHSIDYKYVSLSAKYIVEMRRLLEYDGLKDLCTDELAALEQKLSPTLDEAMKIDDEYIRSNLADEIVRRYYGLEGTYRYFAKTDNHIRRAIELLGDQGEMQRILSPQN